MNEQDSKTARENLINKIRKLQAMCESNGASENEAMMAAKAMARLIAEFGVTQTELELKRDANGCICDAYTDYNTGSKYAGWATVMNAIAKLFDCKHYYARGKDDPLDMGLVVDVMQYYFFGFPEDVAAAKAMARLIHAAVIAETAREFVAPKRKVGVKAAKVTSAAKHQFQIGMGDRLHQRILDLRVVTYSNSTALVSLKGQLVVDKWKQYLHDNDMHLRSGTGPIRDTSSNAFQAGKAAGDRVNLGGKSVARTAIN